MIVVGIQLYGIYHGNGESFPTIGKFFWTIKSNEDYILIIFSPHYYFYTITPPLSLLHVPTHPPVTSTSPPTPPSSQTSQPCPQGSSKVDPKLSKNRDIITGSGDRKLKSCLIQHPRCRHHVNVLFQKAVAGKLLFQPVTCKRCICL